MFFRKRIGSRFQEENVRQNRPVPSRGIQPSMRMPAAIQGRRPVRQQPGGRLVGTAGQAGQRRHAYISQYKTESGHWDVDKLMSAGGNIGQMYSAFGPFVSRFFIRR